MRIALVHPTTWPGVRRGTERFLNDFARYMAARGHDVTVVSSSEAPTHAESFAGYRTEYYRSLWHPAMARFGVLDYHVFPLTAFGHLVRKRKYHIVHCFNFTDALVAESLRLFLGHRVVLHLTSTPPGRDYRRALSLGGSLLRRACIHADEVITVGRAQREIFSEKYNIASTLFYPPIDLEAFPLSPKSRSLRPIILCASALEDRRKGRRLLMRAFNRVKQVRRGAVLQISSPLSRALSQELLDLVDPEFRADVQFVGVGALEALPTLLANASVLVIPSLWEALPLVVLEAFATGTPAVGSNEGGIPELICNRLVGCTFTPGPSHMAEPSNLEGLVEAILETLELSVQPETPLACRAVAQQFSWETLGPAYENLYERLLAKRHGALSGAESRE